MQKETPATQPVQYKAGEYRQFHVIKAGEPAGEEAPTFEGEQGTVKLTGDIITDDGLLIDHARSRGFMVRHYGTLKVSRSYEYAGRDNVQVYTRQHGIVTDNTEFKHEVTA